jgi:hypothetical protein
LLGNLTRQDPDTDRLVVVYPGDRRYELEDEVEVAPLREWLPVVDTFRTIRFSLPY